MRGLERWFMDLVTDPEFCEALLPDRNNQDILARLKLGSDRAARRAFEGKPCPHRSARRET